MWEKLKFQGEIMLRTESRNFRQQKAKRNIPVAGKSGKNNHEVTTDKETFKRS